MVSNQFDIVKMYTLNYDSLCWTLSVETGDPV